MFTTTLLLAVLAQAAPAPAAATTAPAATAPAAAEPAGPAASPNMAQAPGLGWMPLLNGENLDGWYTFRQADGKNNDALHIFKPENGMIHVLDVDPTKSQLNGYLATNEEFRNYRLRLEYKWGTIKLPVPRHPEGLPRDAGLLYHMTGADAVWPMCVEFQIQEHDAGDVWLLPNQPKPNPTASSTALAGADGQPYLVQANARGNFTYMEGGLPVVDKGGRIYHSAQYDLLEGWNTVELIASENNAVHIVNGHVNNAMTNLQLPNNGGPMVQGKILLQEENNEVFYRKVEIKPLFADRFGGPAYKILIYNAPLSTALMTEEATKTRTAAVAAIKKLGGQNNFTVDVAENSTAFTDNNLNAYKAVVFLGESWHALTPAQQLVFQNYIKAGGGYVGVHAANSGINSWPWYGKFIGVSSQASPGATTQAVIKILDPGHASTSSLPLSFLRREDADYFSLTASAHALVDETRANSSGQAIADIASHPIAWCLESEGGRAFSTLLGSTSEDWSNPLIQMHLLGGIMYAAGTDGSPPPGATVLFDGKDTSHWLGKDNATFSWNFHDGVIEPPPATYPNGTRVMVGDLHTKETFTDFQLHVEFKVPATKSPETRNAETNEQARGNSGIYLQGRYETQILDSFDHPLQDKNDEGAIYEVKDAVVNAALPADVWQSYDITFHAARWQDGKKTVSAHVTAYLNGVLVQKDTEIPGPTRSSMVTDDGPSPGPIALQDHLNPVQFRLVWIKPLAEK